VNKDTIYNTKIQHRKTLKYFLLIVVMCFAFSSFSQVYSVDVKPQEKRSTFSLKKIFQREPKEVRKAKREQRKKEKKATYNELKVKKKYWKRVDKPKEIGTDRKVYRRMKKNLKRAERIQKNKNPDNKLVQLSRKKIKLPKISDTKIQWPWTKKSSNE